MNFENFECDKCGACCSKLIIEPTYFDAMREPRLFHLCTDRQGLRDGTHCVMVQVPTNDCRCAFLGDGNLCSIYPTRPEQCVRVEAGDAKCQLARTQAGLPWLRDKDGNLPSDELMEMSYDEYGMNCEIEKEDEA